MGTEPRRVDATLETKLPSVDLGEELAQRVAGTVGFDEDEQSKIAMAVRECVINAMQHGNLNDARKSVGLSFTLLDDRLIVQVRDQGRGFDLSGVPDPCSDENLLRSSGRGLFLVRCFMDDLQVESGRNGGATVTMTKLYSSNNSHDPQSEPEKEKRE